MEIKNKKIGKKKIIIVFATLVLISFFGIAAATLYDDLVRLENENCNLIDYGKVSFSETELISRFGLSGATPNCTFILDYLPYEPATLDLVWFPDPWYAEIEHIYDDEEYLLLLGENESALEDLVDLAVNYENHEILSEYEEVISFPLDYFEDEPPASPDDNCTDSSGDIYVGNAGSYEDEEETIYFESSCIDYFGPLEIEYPFCHEEVFQISYFACDCVGGKCIATVSEVFYWMDNFGLPIAPGYRNIDHDFLHSAITSWLNN